MGIWDSNFKQLVNANPQAFADWLLPGARIIRELSEHLNRTLDIDSLYESGRVRSTRKHSIQKRITKVARRPQRPKKQKSTRK